MIRPYDSRGSPQCSLALRAVNDARLKINLEERPAPSLIRERDVTRKIASLLITIKC